MYALIRGWWRRWLVRRPFGLFLLSLCLCLGLGMARASHAQLLRTEPAPVKQGVVESAPVKQASLEQASLEQGLERYRQGDVLSAIALWQQRLTDLSLPAESEAIPTLQQYLARAYQQVGQLSEAMTALDELTAYYRATDDTRQLGRILTEKARVYGELGQPQNALLAICADKTQTITCEGETLIGAESDGALAIATQRSDVKGQAAALGVLGQTYYLQGNYTAAISALDASLALALSNQYVPYQIAANDTLGSVYLRLSQRSYSYAQFARQAQDSSEAERLTAEAEDSDQQAVRYFEQAISLARKNKDREGVLRSQLNLILPLYRSSNNLSEAEDLLAAAQQQIAALPDKREKAYAAIRVAGLTGQLQALSRQALEDQALESQALANGVIPDQALSIGFAQCIPVTSAMATQLQQAVQVSRRIQDTTAESFALGWLGHLYECEGDYAAAKTLSDRAQLLAQRPETRYLWEWQAGRILEAEGKAEQAIALYERTVTTLKQVESDIAVANRDLRLDFRDTVEGIYRQLTELQLDQAALASRSGRAKQQVSQTTQRGDLLSALYTLDGLRLAELRNYLGGECDLPSIAQLSQSATPSLGPIAATISTLILKDRLAVILALPDEGGKIQTRLHEIPLSKAALTAQVNDFRYALEQRSDRTNRYLTGSQQMYDWLVRPFEAVLSDRGIQTLTFNHDGVLRMVPMAALHDGEQFLVESYAIASSPSFVAATAPLMSDSQLRVLAFGLTQPASVSATERFASLNAVETELAQIEETLPNSTVLLNEDFTLPQLESSLSELPFSVLHLATHAQFGYDSDDTFLVTGGKVDSGSPYNRPLRLNELYRLLRKESVQASSLNMLVLSACETAVGSERDALGIAGVAIQAGVESAVASLWQVDDGATAELTADFYRYLQTGENRTVALQTAQKDWLRSQSSGYRHPGYWAALVLVENGAA